MKFAYQISVYVKMTKTKNYSSILAKSKHLKSILEKKNLFWP